MPDFDFLRLLEAAIENMEELEDGPHRKHITPDGEEGILNVTMSNGGTYSIWFQRL